MTYKFCNFQSTNSNYFVHTTKCVNTKFHIKCKNPLQQQQNSKTTYIIEFHTKTGQFRRPISVYTNSLNYERTTHTLILLRIIITLYNTHVQLHTKLVQIFINYNIIMIMFYNFKGLNILGSYG